MWKQVKWLWNHIKLYETICHFMKYVKQFVKRCETMWNSYFVILQLCETLWNETRYCENMWKSLWKDMKGCEMLYLCFYLHILTSQNKAEWTFQTMKHAVMLAMNNAELMIYFKKACKSCFLQPMKLLLKILVLYWRISVLIELWR